MTLSLRSRILVTLLPLWLLLAALGIAAMLLLLQLSGRIDVILKENYDSVLYMERLHDALERIDSSLLFALGGMEKLAKEQFDEQWPIYDRWLAKEQGNITLEGEKELVEKLTELSAEYRQQGERYFRLQDAGARRRAYFDDEPGRPSCHERFKAIKKHGEAILVLNQENMKEAARTAERTAAHSVYWFAGGLLLTAVLAGLLAWSTLRTILEPIRALRRAAQGIAAGDLDQVLPTSSGDELGELSQAFNTMARHLREFRRSQSSRLLRAQRTSQATIDSFPDPVLVLDAEGTIEMANPAARHLLGVLPRQEGQATSGLWSPPEALRRPLTEALQGQQNFLPDGFDHALRLGVNGQERTMLPRILTIRDPEGDLLGAAVLLQDVTRLQVLDEVKSNLVATVSHELKTPLTGVRLAIHLLIEEAAGPLTSKQIELLLDARENSERLLAMVENLLNLARFEQGRRQLEFRPERPIELLRNAAEAVRSRAADRGVDIRLDVPPDLPAVAVDAMRMETALGNLLDNALTYTERGGSIALAAAVEPDGVSLSVSDTGQGIPADALPHVFEKFFRVPGQSRPGGTGLGLAIVHEIVSAHGGRITCESEPGKGTTFRITLPSAGT